MSTATTAEERARTAGAVSPALLLVLALLSAVAPFATDLYLPAFPEMTTDLAASATSVQLTLTAFLVGLAVGQLVFGPLSDRFGRRTPLIVGALITVVASVAAALAPSIEFLVVARLVQGLAGAAGMVIGRAIISDLSSGPAAARAFSLMMIVGGVAPVIAPLAGSLLVDPIGWRGILLVVLGLAIVMFLAVLLVVRETHTTERRRAVRAQGRERGTLRRALLSRPYLANTLAFGFGFSVMMAYISASPFLYQGMMGLDEISYGLLFGLNALALAATSGVSAKLSDRVAPRTLLGGGLTGALISSLVLLVLVVSGAPAGWFGIPMFTAVASLGLVLGNATALALAAVPQAAGVASALLGALQFALAALVSPLVNLGGTESALALAIVMTACAVLAVGAFAFGRARRAARV